MDQSESIVAGNLPGGGMAPSMAATLQAMREVLASKFGVESQALTDETPLASLGLDSLAFIEYSFELENVLHVTLPDLPRDLVSVGDLARFIDAEVVRQAPAAT